MSNIKTWQERRVDFAARKDRGTWLDEECMEEEITDLRAALVKAESDFINVIARNGLLRHERDAALEKLAALAADTTQRMEQIESQFAMQKRITATALDERAALAAQEPVAVFDVLVRDGVAAIRIAESAFFARLKSGDKLYAAAGAAPVPEGWQLVPTEPTDELIELLYGPYLTFAAHESRKKSYKEMLTAAPKEPA